MDIVNADIDRALRGMTSNHVQSKLRTVGIWVSRYGLVVVLLLIGVLKFTQREAAGIQPLVAHSPLMSWMYGLLSPQQRAVGLVRPADENVSREPHQ